MIVDDEPENLRILEHMLVAQGLAVRVFVKGAQALEAAGREPPDLVLLDVRMPEMNGYEVCRRIRELPALRDTPVIFISALHETEDIIRGFRAGGADYIPKPVREEELLARVQVQLALRRSQQELEHRNRELDAQYQRLRTLEQLRDNLVHMVVHDLRAPLQGISLLLEVLHGAPESVSAEKRHEYLGQAYDTTRAMARMLRTMLDVSRLEEGKLPLHPEELAVPELFAEASRTLGALTSGRTIRLTDDCVGRHLFGDRDLCVRILVNLLDNALKYTPVNAPIAVGFAETDGSASIWVRDRGPGIPAAERKHLFEKFMTGSSPRHGKARAFGLGLPFCQMAAQAHGGSIAVASEPGQGSTFTLTLPKRQETRQRT
jgi:signal transduction histidine kinase